MKKNFTQLISGTDHFRQRQFILLTLFLFAILLIVSQQAAAQTVTNISPKCGIVGQGFRMTISGSGFNTSGNNSAKVKINGNIIPDPVSVTATTIVVDIPASAIPTIANYEVVVTQKQGNENSLPKTLTIIGTPTVTSAQRCGGGSVTLTATGAPTGAGYQWYESNGAAISGATGSTFTTPDLSATTTYSVSMTAPDNCESTKANVTATINAVPDAPTTTSNSRCGNGSVQLSASGAPSGGSYRWYDTESGGTALTGATAATYTTPGLSTTTTYYVSTVSPAGCESTTRTAVTATINPIPDAPGAVSAARCGAGTVQLGATGAPANGSYRWYTASSGGTAIPDETGANYTTPELSTTTTYYVSTVSDAGCESTTRTAVTATINTIPTASVTTSGATTFCQGGQVILTAVATPASGTYTYQWYNGTMQITGATGVTYTATTNGNYNVVITNTTGNCISEASGSVAVTVNPVPDQPVVTGGEVCDQGTITLSATVGDNGDVVRWYSANSGGSPIATGTSYTTPNISATTTYYASSYNSTTGCESARVAVTATVHPLPAVSITTNLAAEYCTSDASISLTGSPAGPGGAFRILKNGVEVATGASFNPGTLGAGTYTIEYSYTDGNSCTNTATKTVMVKQQPTITVTDNLEICVGESAALTASGATTYTWSPATGLSATTGASVTATPTQTTTYTVIGTTDGCQSVAKTVTVTVNELPDVTITPTGPTEFCPENYVELLAVNVPGYSYVWYKTGSSAPVGYTYNYQATQTGSYYVTITTNNGCVLTSEVLAVKVADVPAEATITVAGATTFCQGGSVKFDANKAPAGQTYIYQWEVNTGSGFTTIPGAESSSYVATTAGIYRVLVSNTKEEDEDTEQCVKTSTGVEVTVLPQPTANITTQGSTVCKSPSGATTFTVTGTYSGGTGVWSATNGFTITAGPQSTVNGVTTSTVTVTAPANLTSITSSVVTLSTTNTAASCTQATSSITVTVQPLIAGNTITGATNYCQGATATALNTSGTLTGGTGSYTYQWQQGTSAEGTFINISGANNAAYTPSTATGGTLYYRRVVNSGTCSDVSDALAVTVTPTIVNSISTATTAYCQNGTASAIGGAVTGGNGTGTYTYAWQSSASTSGPWATIGGAASTDYTPPTGTAGTTYYKRIVTSGNCANQESNVITITVHPTIVNTISGTSGYCQNATATAIGGTVSGGNGTYTYSWQVKNGAGGTWDAIGGNTASLTPSTAQAGEFYYKRIVTSGACVNEESNEFKVTIQPGIINTVSGPATYSYCQNTPATTITGTVSGGDGNYTYAWQSSTAATGPWGAAGGTNNQAAYTPSTGTAGTIYYRRMVSSGMCTTPVASAVIAVTVTPAITANSIASSQEVCSGKPIAALTGTVSGGESSKTYVWEMSTDNFAAAANTSTVGSEVSYTPAVQTVTTETIYYYRRKVISGECTSVSNVVTVKIKPLPAVDGVILTSKKIAYTGDNAYQLTASVSGATFSGPGVDSATGIFTPCTAGAGTKTITITVTSANGCTNTTTDEIIVKQSTYTVVVTANPLPFCRGDLVTYTSKVYRDVTSVVYPYLVDNLGRPVYENGTLVPSGSGNFPVANPNYPFPGGTPEIIKAMAYRYFEPVVTGGTLVDPSLFEYQWHKNEKNDRKDDGTITTDAGLSSMDYYGVYVTSKSSNSCVPYLNQQVSDRKYSAEIPKYSISLSANDPICPGQPVTFTATLDSGFPYWDIANLQMELVLSRGGVILATATYSGSNTIQFTTDAASAGGFVNGDQVYVRFSSILDTYNTTSKCAGKESSNTVIIDVAIAQTMTGGGAYCSGGAGVPVGIGGSQVGISYQLLRDGVAVGTPVAGTGSAISFGNQTVAGAYTVQTTTAAGSNCSVYGPINVYVTPLPTVFSVTGGGERCTDGAALPIGLSGSQSGVTYQLRYTVNGSTSNVGSAVSGNGSPISFPAQTLAGTYTVIATTISNTSSNPPVASCPQAMSGSAAVIVNSLPTVAVNSPATCSGTATTVTATVTSGTAPFSYAWTVPSGATNPGNVSSFQTMVAGSYSVVVTDSKGCAGVTASGVVTVNPLPAVTVNSPTTCSGTATTVTATAANGTGPYNYAWTVPSGATAPGNVASFQTTVGGTYSVVVTDSKGCASASGSGIVTIKQTKVGTGFISAENERGPITADNPIKVNEWVKFTVTTDIAPDDVRLYNWYIGSLETDQWGDIVASGTANTFTMTPTTDTPFDVKVEITTAAEACYVTPVRIYTDQPIKPLPVELIYLRVEKQDNNTVIKWATAMEQNNEGFEVQVSQDGRNYRKLAFVATQNGNTTVKQAYEYVDKENGKYGTRYYRLKQMDYGGKYTYYGPRLVTFGTTTNKLLAYPNPFTKEVNLDVETDKEGTMEIIVTNLLGKEVLKKTIEMPQGKSTITLDMGDALPGSIYVVTTRINGFTNNFKLLRK